MEPIQGQVPPSFPREQMERAELGSAASSGLSVWSQKQRAMLGATSVLKKHSFQRGHVRIIPSAINALKNAGRMTPSPTPPKRGRKPR